MVGGKGKTSDWDFALWERELGNRTPDHSERRWMASVACNRLLGRRAIELTYEKLNHDPLAHVWQLLEAGSLTPELQHKISVEMVTDLGERSPDLGFYKTFDYQVQGDDLVSDTGLHMRSMLQKSLEATRQDVTRDSRRTYGLAREQVQNDQLDMILNWYHGDELGMYGFASLCPRPQEVSGPDVVSVNGFKAERALASLWFYERKPGGLRMTAFSLDQCTLESLQMALDLCGIDHKVAATSLDELAQAIASSHATPDDLKKAHEFVVRDLGYGLKAGEANSEVEKHPEVLLMYRKFVVTVSNSLRYGVVSTDLAELLQTVRRHNTPACLEKRRHQKLDVPEAREIMEFVRSRLLPEYIFGLSDEQRSYSGGDVSAASSSAASRATSYDGACPSSSTQNSQDNETGELIGSGLLYGLSVDRIERDIAAVERSRGRGDCSIPSCENKKVTLYGCAGDICASCNSIWVSTYRQSRGAKGLTYKDIDRVVADKNRRSKSHKQSNIGISKERSRLH